ncbi:hypothetical protein ANO14919_032500 [Xylariales sp. No.14919]|nr:hypothetical protein ANO14919_032500 [Xylariales sp. No.14919]
MEILVNIVVVVFVALVVGGGFGVKCGVRVFNGSLREPSEHGLSVTFFFPRVGQRGGGLLSRILHSREQGWSKVSG